MSSDVTPKRSRPPKAEWHPVSLQQLPLGRFIQVVNRILEGRYAVIPELLPRRENGNGDAGSDVEGSAPGIASRKSTA